MQHWEIAVCFLFISFVYSSVGFGGGSSYLAILAMYALPYQETRLTALVCNIIVVTGGTVVFASRGQVNIKKILPLVVAGVPMAYLGARMKMEEQTYFIILGISLIVAAVLLWIKMRYYEKGTEALSRSNYVREVLLGGGIGFVSGVVGIGGGIFLSPLLNLMKWDSPKKIAATASVFILVNSISGIGGQLSNGSNDINYILVLVLGISVLIGGQLGARLGSAKFNPLVVRRVTASLVFIAGIEILYRHLQ